MPHAKQGDTVHVHYTGRLEDGTVFDTSENREPLRFTIGEGNIIPGFEHAVIGMSPGDSKTERIAADQAYGPYREDMILEVERTRFPEDIEPQVGLPLQLRRSDGQTQSAVVSEVTDEMVKLDANHPLAGQDLIFDIQLLEIR